MIKKMSGGGFILFNCIGFSWTRHRCWWITHTNEELQAKGRYYNWFAIQTLHIMNEIGGKALNVCFGKLMIQVMLERPGEMKKSWEERKQQYDKEDGYTQ